MDDRAPLQHAIIVFDLDGTIADTAGDLIAAANVALIAEGFERAEAGAILQGVGYGTKAMLRSGLASIGREADNAMLQRMADRLVAHYEDHIAEHTQLFPGFLDAAKLLKNHGARLALCTNKREYLAKKLLAALGISELFDAIAGGDTFAFHKPDPRHITELVRVAGGDVSFALMVGDSEADIAAAQAAGIPSIAVTFGYAAIPADKLGANVTLSHFDQLPALAHKLLIPEKSI